MRRPRLFDRFPELQATLGHCPLSAEDSPLREIDAGLWVKDDGAYGTLYGGNKTRKLEWILPRAATAPAILTVGGTGTNHGLATAVYARDMNLPCVLVLFEQPDTEAVQRQLARFEHHGAIVYRVAGPAGVAPGVAQALLRHATGGRLPYVLGPGGSSPLGTLGAVECGLELGDQIHSGLAPEPGEIVLTLGTCGTAAGVLLGLRLSGIGSRVIGVRITHLPGSSFRTVKRLYRGAAALLQKSGATFDLEPLTKEQLEIEGRFVGPGYGHVTPEAEAAAGEARRLGGLELDLVYTAKTWAAMRARLAEASLGRRGPVLYLHTHDRLSSQAWDPS